MPLKLSHGLLALTKVLVEEKVQISALGSFQKACIINRRNYRPSIVIAKSHKAYIRQEEPLENYSFNLSPSKAYRPQVLQGFFGH